MQDLIHGVPIVGNSLASLASELKGFPLLIGGLVGAGAALLKYFQSLDEAGRKTLTTIQDLGTGMVASSKETAQKLAIIRAQSKDEDLKVLTLTRDAALAQSEEVRDKRIRAAEQELETRDLFGRRITQLSMAGMAEIAAAEKAHLDTRKVLQAQFNADVKKLEDERKKASLEWMDKELARIQEIDDAMRGLARLRTAATIEGQVGVATRAGDPVAAARAQFAQQTEALKVALEDQIQLQAAKLNKGEILDREFEIRKRELIEITAQRQQALTDQFVRNEQAAYTSVDTALRTLLDRLGPGFEDLTEQLDISEEVDKSRASFQTIQAAFETGRLSAAQAGEAVRIVTEQLLAQGATINQIAVVVPEQLRSMTSLFRGMRSVIEGTTVQIGGVQAVMDQLSPQPIAILTDGWYQAARAVEAYRLQVAAIAQSGPVIPRAGMTVLPGEGAVTPRGGLSTEDRQALADALADDERRGLSGE